MADAADREVRLGPGGVTLLTFDCYGTLVDWERGAIAAFGRHVAPHLYVGQLAEVVERWEQIQFQALSAPYRPYREILGESVRRTVEALDLPAPVDDGFLADAMGAFPAFPDTREALARLSRRAPLWILSNIDDDILARTLEGLAAPIAGVLTAERLRSYKPALAHFREVLARTGRRPEEVLHVAFGFRYDIVPAASLGFRTAWINRAGDVAPRGVTPDVEVPDLRSLADLLA